MASRHGQNVYGTSLLALEFETGKLRWFYQFVHHDVWNHDIPDAPHLLDITVKGRRIPMLAQATKQGCSSVELDAFRSSRARLSHRIPRAVSWRMFHV